ATSTRQWRPPVSLESGRHKKSGRSTAFATRSQKTRARERGANHMALSPPRPFITEGDDGHLRPLGARRTEAPSSQDGRRLPGLSCRTQPVLAPALERTCWETDSACLQVVLGWAGQGSNL